MLIKAYRFIKNNSFANNFRKVYYKFCCLTKINLYSSFRSYIYFKSFIVKIGKNVNLSGLSFNLSIGKNINIYDSCKFEFNPNSKFMLGNNIIFSYGVIVSCRNKITIGSNVQIGEYTSIRDATHNYKGKHTIIMHNDDLVGEVEIGNNVWIGRNCLIAPGAKIGNGVVVGANSIVKGVLEDNGVYAGNPIRKIGNR